jgi:hypothetical protein
MKLWKKKKILFNFSFFFTIFDSFVIKENQFARNNQFKKNYLRYLTSF